jgi:mono/diheme cytochrome c family protein
MKVKVICSLLLAIITLTYYSCQNEEQINYMRYYTSGQQLYKTRCQNCHGAQGEGLAALIPPLTDSVYLKSNRAQLACYVQNGLNLPIMVHNKPYAGQMLPVNLAPIEIAQVLTYVQNSFGNHLGLHNVEQVSAELKKCE